MASACVLKSCSMTSYNRDDEWLRTPGIAHCSVRQMNAMSVKTRLGKAVMLGFNDTPTSQRIKENHERHMINLRARFLEMQSGKNVEEGKEVKTEMENSEPPRFGTTSSFCNKNRERRPNSKDWESPDGVGNKREADSLFHGETATTVAPSQRSAESHPNILPVFTGEVELELKDPRLTELLVYSRAEVVSRREDDTGRKLVRVKIVMQPVVKDTR